MSRSFSILLVKVLGWVWLFILLLIIGEVVFCVSLCVWDFRLWSNILCWLTFVPTKIRFILSHNKHSHTFWACTLSQPHTLTLTPSQDTIHSSDEWDSSDDEPQRGKVTYYFNGAARTVEVTMDTIQMPTLTALTQAIRWVQLDQAGHHSLPKLVYSFTQNVWF